VQRLLILAGPIGAGKSTIAGLVVRRLADAGLVVAAVDLDDVTFQQLGTTDVYDLWRRGAEATAALVREWFDLGTDVVVTHGPFFESAGYEALLGRLPSDVLVHHVQLTVPVDLALVRAEADLTRGLSRDPDFLRSTHERFEELKSKMPPADREFDTCVRSAEAIADDLAAFLMV
jgi:shikimate kinase